MMSCLKEKQLFRTWYHNNQVQTLALATPETPPELYPSFHAKQRLELPGLIVLLDQRYQTPVDPGNQHPRSRPEFRREAKTVFHQLTQIPGVVAVVVAKQAR